MIKEILEALNESNEEIKLTLKDVIGYDSIEDMQDDAGTNWREDKVGEEISDFLDNWFEEQSHRFDRFAVPVSIEVTEDRVYLSDWETFDEEGNGYPSTKDEIKHSIDVLKKTDLEDECYSFVFNV